MVVVKRESLGELEALINKSLKRAKSNPSKTTVNELNQLIKKLEHELASSDLSVPEKSHITNSSSR